MASTPRTTLADITPEGATSLLSGSLVDEAGVALGSSQLTTFTLTLYSASSGLPVINSRSNVDIKNAGPGTIDGSGAWTITLTPADNAIVSSAVAERHIALLEWTYATGTKAGKHEVEFIVQNLAKVTS